MRVTPDQVELVVLALLHRMAAHAPLTNPSSAPIRIRETSAASEKILVDKVFFRQGSEKTFKLLDIAHDLAKKRGSITKRSLLYEHKCVFTSDKVVNQYLHKVVTLLGCQLPCDIGILPGSRGLVVGNLRLVHDQDIVDVGCLDVKGWPIPPTADSITDIKSQANFVLVVEKDATLQRLVQANFHHNQNCILVTGKGYPDLATRVFLGKVVEFLRIPVKCLVDSNPNGIHIYMTYKHGAQNQEHPRVPSTELVGILQRDLKDNQSDRGLVRPIEQRERKMCEQLLSRASALKDPNASSELQEMLRPDGKVADMEAVLFGPHGEIRTELIRSHCANHNV